MRSSWEQRGVANPGSNLAKLDGCICPILDNNHGKGFVMDHERVFWITLGCPMHSPIEDTAPL